MKTQEPQEPTGRALLYFRCSTQQQADSGLGLEAQEKVCRDYCRKRGLEIAMAYEDAGITTRIPFHERPSGKNCYAALQQSFNEKPWAMHLVVYSMSRLWRSFQEGQADIAWFRENEISLHLVSDGIVIGGGEALTSAERFSQTIMVSCLLASAQFERDQISERTREGMAAAKARGDRIGRPPVGYVLDERTKVLKPVPGQLRSIGALLALHRQGLGYQRIADEATALGFKNHLGSPWIKTTVRYHLGRLNNVETPNRERLNREANEAYARWLCTQT